MTPRRPVYLDNAATTRCSPEAATAVQRHLLDDFGNPSSAHELGARAGALLEKARRGLQRHLRARRARVVFTSGGTEANNLAIFGIARAHRRRHLLVSAIEHDSVLSPARALAAKGFDIETVPVDARGHVAPGDLIARVRPDTALVCVMHGNNEIGTLQPIAEIARGVHDRNRQTAVHVDAVQSVAWEVIDFDGWGIDSLSLSGHKLHGPKGVGALLVRERLVLDPLLHGGGQQAGLRSGTENVPGIAGLFAALTEVVSDRADAAERIRALRDRLVEGVLASVPGVVQQTGPNGLPHIASLAFPGVTGEVLLHHLESEGIYVSTGSACHAAAGEGSSVLEAIGAAPEELRATIRFSLSRETMADDIDRVLDTLPAAVEELRCLEA
ncbi:MAG: cysteine desulfurase family protein [Planctomycetota bacterium]